MARFRHGGGSTTVLLALAIVFFQPFPGLMTIGEDGDENCFEN